MFHAYTKIHLQSRCVHLGLLCLLTTYYIQVMLLRSFEQDPSAGALKVHALWRALHGGGNNNCLSPPHAVAWKWSMADHQWALLGFEHSDIFAALGTGRSSVFHLGSEGQSTNLPMNPGMWRQTFASWTLHMVPTCQPEYE